MEEYVLFSLIFVTIFVTINYFCIKYSLIKTTNI